MSYQTFSDGFRKLLAWQRAHELTLLTYTITRNFPKEEKFGIVSQLRRASSSIGAQLAEGSRMPTNAHRKIYYDRAYASAAEVDNFIELAKDLGYVEEKIYKQFLEYINKTSYLVHQLSLSCERKT